MKIRLTIDQMIMILSNHHRPKYPLTIVMRGISKKDMATLTKLLKEAKQ